MPVEDVPSPIDFHDPAQAAAWVAETVRKRPARPLFFQAFTGALTERFDKPFTVLELGSGPGHLAEQVLQACPDATYTALDFSPAMHDVARERTAANAERITFVERDFRQADWMEGLGKFDAVITMQAAHETRHKSRLQGLMAQAKGLLTPFGVLLYCDHYAEEESELFVGKGRQLALLRRAGFKDVHRLLDEGGMALYQAAMR